MAGADMNVTWESVLAEGKTRLADRLVYYDLSGKRYEGTPGGWLADAMKVFQGTRKAVRRSTGGLVNAEPYELVVLGDSQDGSYGELRVRVRFKDFKRTADGTVTGAEYVVHTKTVQPRELSDAFPTEASSGRPQRFLLDFGQGAVPIHVFHTEADKEGNLFAYFTELVDADHVRTARTGSSVKVRIYRVLADVLRKATEEPGAGPVEYQTALANYSRLKRGAARIVPEAFLVGEPFQVPGGLLLTEMESHLRLALHYRASEEKEPPVFQLDEEDGLTPFGAFEK